MIVVVSNRQVRRRRSDHRVFGNRANTAGLLELRIATAKLVDEKWEVELLPESKEDLDAGRPPSMALFERIVADIARGKLSEHWVFFVHGYGDSLQESLTRCQALQDHYGVNVLLFSWPSNTGGLFPPRKNYRRAQRAAVGSSPALDRVLEKLSTYLREIADAANCRVRLSLMAYSLGNHLLESYLLSSEHHDETRIFENVVLTQPDVDVERHVAWVQRLGQTRRVYVTINENDRILEQSGKINPPRLGNTARQLDGKGVVYFDFTQGADIGKWHLLFDKGADKNPVVKEVFRRALVGERAEDADGIVYRQDNNTYVVG